MLFRIKCNLIIFLFFLLIGCSILDTPTVETIIPSELTIKTSQTLGSSIEATQPPLETPVSGSDPYPQINDFFSTSTNIPEEHPYPEVGSDYQQGQIIQNPTQYSADDILLQSTEFIETQQPYSIVHVTYKATAPETVVMNSGKYQMIEFFAYWCPICKSMAPVMYGLQDRYMGKVTFIFLDIDDENNEQNKIILGYRYQPHFILLDSQGAILNQWLGRVTEEEFISVLSALP